MKVFNSLLRLELFVLLAIAVLVFMAYFAGKYPIEKFIAHAPSISGDRAEQTATFSNKYPQMWVLKLEAFDKLKMAQDLQQLLLNEGLPAFILKNNTKQFEVYVGASQNKQDLQTYEAKLKANGYNHYLIQTINYYYYDVT